MRIFVVCGGRGSYSGRIFAHQLRDRLSGAVDVDWGSTLDLQERRSENYTYRYVLNMGETTKFVAGCHILNETSVVTLTNNRRVCRMKLKLKKIPAPDHILKADHVYEALLPMIGRCSAPGDSIDFWTCYTMEHVQAAHEGGATHFVKRIPDSREFRVHGVAPGVSIHKSSAKDYKILKVSERITTDKANIEFNPANKKLAEGYYFGAPKDKEDPLIPVVTDAGRHVLREMNMHWGTVSFIVGRDGIPLASKIDSHINLKEDQVNIVPLFTNAICKMLGYEPKTITRRRPFKRA